MRIIYLVSLGGEPPDMAFTTKEAAKAWAMAEVDDDEELFEIHSIELRDE